MASRDDRWKGSVLVLALAAAAIAAAPGLAERATRAREKTVESARLPEPLPPPRERGQGPARLPPARLARAFGAADPARHAPRVAAEPVKTPEPALADWLRPIGRIGDQRGVEWLYLKDGNSGMTVAVRLDREPSEGVRLLGETSEYWIVEVGGNAYKARKR